MFFSRKAKERAEQEERQKDERYEQAQAELHHVKVRTNKAYRRIDERVGRNHISEGLAQMIQGARG